MSGPPKLSAPPSRLGRAGLVVVAALVAAACSTAAGRPGDDPGAALASGVPRLRGSSGACGTAEDGMTRYLDSRGRCVPVDDVVRVQCSSDHDPMLVVGSRRFLGGRFAVEVDAAPDGAEILARAGDQELLAVPGSPPFLYVRTPDSIERWLTVERPRSEEHPTALFLGDSVMVGSSEAVVRALPGWTTQFDAEVGRSTLQGVDAAEEHDASDVDAYVIELGTNEFSAEGFRDKVDALLELAAGAPLIVWVTVERGEDFVFEINQTIREAMSELPNAAVADWANAVTSEGLIEDGIHPNEQGQAVMANLLSSTLEGWFAAASGRRSVEC